MNQLQERLLIVLGNLGGSGTPEDIQHRAEIGKHIDVIKQALRDLEMQGKVTLMHDKEGMIATIKTKATNGNFKSRAKKPLTSDQKTALVKECLEANPDASIDEISEGVGIPRGSVTYHKARIKAGVGTDGADDDLPDDPQKPLDDALNDLKEKLNAAPGIKIENIGLKVDVLTRLADILVNRTIANVLLEIKNDLMNCHSEPS